MLDRVRFEGVAIFMRNKRVGSTGIILAAIAFIEGHGIGEF
jgi:hypothetical protein